MESKGRKKFIYLPYGGIKKIANDVGASQGSVRLALRWATDTPLAREIRAKAQEMLKEN